MHRHLRATHLRMEKGGQHTNSPTNLHGLHHPLCAEHHPPEPVQPHRQHQARIDPDLKPAPGQGQGHTEHPQAGNTEGSEGLPAPTTSSIPSTGRGFCNRGKSKGQKSSLFSWLWDRAQKTCWMGPRRAGREQVPGTWAQSPADCTDQRYRKLHLRAGEGKSTPIKKNVDDADRTQLCLCPHSRGKHQLLP